MILRQSGSMTLLVLMILSLVLLSLGGLWQRMVARRSIIVASVIAEREERLLAGIGHIAVALIHEQGPILSERSFSYKVPVPLVIAPGYEGHIAISKRGTLITVENNLLYQEKLRKTLMITIAYDQQKQSGQLLTWIVI